MAVVHPSRLNLVPRDAPPPSYSDRRRSRSRSRSPRRSRSPSRNREREREKGRRSPDYEDYRDRPPPPPPSSRYPPPARNGNGNSYYYGGGTGRDFLESRRIQRESKTVYIWPPSPKTPTRDLSPADKHRRRRKRSTSTSTVSSSSSTASTASSASLGRRGKKKKSKKKAGGKKHHSKHHRSSRRNRHRTRSRSVGSDSDRRDRDRDGGRDRDRDRKRRRTATARRTPSRSRSRSSRTPQPTKARPTGPMTPPSPSPSASPPRTPLAQRPDLKDEEEEWIEAPTAADTFVADLHPTTTTTRSKSDKAQPATSAPNNDDSDDDTLPGPQPLIPSSSTHEKVRESIYGTSLLKGEGSAMAAFLLSDPSARIPRRGEIGLESQQIADFEASGYVMSGSRHKRMNAVRIRKENQVISAEEKRGILKLQREERDRREAILREEFKELVKDKLKAVEK